MRKTITVTAAEARILELRLDSIANDFRCAIENERARKVEALRNDIMIETWSRNAALFSRVAKTFRGRQP